MAVIRTYQDSDRAGLVQLWSSVFPDDPPHNEPNSVLDEKRKLDDNLIFVAEHEHLIIGACMAGYDGHRGWLYAVAVMPEHRRLGAGKKLVKHAVEALRGVGCRKVNLQIRADNTEVEKFYSSLDFAVEQRMSMGLLL